MKYFPLVWAGLWRKKVRTILTMLSIVIAFLLFGLLQTINLGMSGIYKDIDADRLFIQNNESMVDGLPIAYLNRIKEVPGVRVVTHWTYFGGFYREARNSFTMFAADIETLFAVYSQLKMPKDQYEAMLHTRTGIIASKSIAAKYGWKVGDKIPIGTAIWPKKDGTTSYQFDLVGILDVSAYGDAAFPPVYIHYDYFDEARAFSKGLITYYVARIDDPHHATQIGNAIDALFVNSSHETKTQSEQVWAQTQIQQVGDIQSIANSIVGAVLFTLLFLTGNTMMQSVRERVPELAVLKTLGFSNLKILILIMLESIALCVVACVAGLFLASVSFRALSGLVGNASLPTAVVLMGMGAAVLLALISGIPPACRAARLNLVDALADR